MHLLYVDVHVFYLLTQLFIQNTKPAAGLKWKTLVKKHGSEAGTKGSRKGQTWQTWCGMGVRIGSI